MKQFPGPSLPLVNMAEELLETVERLQSRLSENQEPRKVETCGLKWTHCKLLGLMVVVNNVALQLMNVVSPLKEHVTL